mgnify:CR=1 FL=1
MPSTRLVPVGGIRHTLAEPGETQVAVRYEVDAASGRVHLTARYAGATDAPTLPAFGLEWTLPKQYENLRFYGLGPEETYHDRLHGGKLGIFERTAAEDNAPYLVPQETGNHEDLRWPKCLTPKDTACVSARPAANISRTSLFAVQLAHAGRGDPPERVAAGPSHVPAPVGRANGRGRRRFMGRARP